MTIFNADLVPQVTAHCETAIGEISQALSRAFGREVQAALGSVGTLPDDGVDPSLAEPGLVIVLGVLGQAAIVLLPKSSGLLPDWYADSGAEDQSKLITLAHELGMLLLPEVCLSDHQQVAAVDDLLAACERGGVRGTEGFIGLDLTAGDCHGTLWMIWPVKPGAILTQPSSAASAGDAAPAGDAERGSDASAPASPRQKHRKTPHGRRSMSSSTRSLRDLPSYTRSLLKIRVPLTVTLAEKKQVVGQILELGPGSIIQFDKSCEEMLDLNVANLPIARGEAVKVGEKFGLRVTSLVLPGERFKPVRAVQK
jgi:flagellar motor switch protein FliN/FliY